MTHHDYLPLIEDLAGDADDILDLIQTTPVLFDADGVPVGYDTSQLFGIEATFLRGRR
jgi:hypothetical protein